mmetsp:Transcript_20199/g.44083  ORF Transcript_20199/g.44083 Transcript_20199/m.44083 type:complete len:574 (+) Transcript_20199:143-1864(+)
MAGAGGGGDAAALVTAPCSGGGDVAKLRKRRSAPKLKKREVLRPMDSNHPSSDINTSITIVAPSNVKETNSADSDGGLVTPTNATNATSISNTGTAASCRSPFSYSNDTTSTSTTDSSVKSTNRKKTKKKNSRRSSTRNHQQQHAPHADASFFSPPRIVREPIPFLSPTTPSYKDFVGTDDVRLLRNPRLTIHYFAQGVSQCVMRNICWPAALTPAVTCTVLGAMALLLGGIYATLNGILDSYFVQTLQDTDTLPSQYAEWLVSATFEAAFWFGCGVLSTAGLGSGVQTGALFLFPATCKLAVEWSDGQSSSSEDTSSFSDLMWAVAIPGFWSGTGSAVGEMLPFVLARMIKAAGGDPFALLEEPDVPDPRSLDFDGGSKRKNKSWTSVLVANTRSAMEGQMLESHVFIKIFVLAAVPNGLFDLCGLVCGSAGIPFWTFFGAVWSGKALVRTPLQTCGLAAAVALSTGAVDDHNMTVTDTSSIRNILLQMGRKTVGAIVRGDDTQPGHRIIGDTNSTASVTSFVVSAIKMAWSAATFGLLGFFLLSTIEQVAQHHAKTVRIQSMERKKRRIRC